MKNLCRAFLLFIMACNDDGGSDNGTDSETGTEAQGNCLAGEVEHTTSGGLVVCCDAERSIFCDANSSGYAGGCWPAGAALDARDAARSSAPIRSRSNGTQRGFGCLARGCLARRHRAAQPIIAAVLLGWSRRPSASASRETTHTHTKTTAIVLDAVTNMMSLCVSRL